MSETEDVHAVAEGNAIRTSPTIVEEDRRRESAEPEPEPEQEPREEEPEEEQVEAAGGCESPLESEKGEEAKSASSGGTGTPRSTRTEQPREDQGRIGNGEERTMAEERTAVGEWNSLPVLVERLRAALEHSLVTGSHRDEEPPALPEDSGIDSEEDFRIRNSMEQPALGGTDREAKDDLKFLEDLLLSDIETALSRLRETLERIDVAALAKHGAASDPSSKIHLLKLVSSLLSRLHIPEESRQQREEQRERRQEQQRLTETAEVALPASPAAVTANRRRRGTRHTIGVSAEELACARKWLEEERNGGGCGGGGGGGGGGVAICKENQKREDPADSGLPAANGRVSEEIRDKCTKDAINQRQSERDKNKEPRLENYRAIAQNTRAEEEEPPEPVDPRTMQETRRLPTVEQTHRTREEPPENRIPIPEDEESGRVGRLVAVLKQRAELSASVGRYASGNKFSAKKSKIKRANTIDIPSYLKLQAESLGQEKSCVSLRRPINVGDKVVCNPVSTNVPSFQPRTENDRKFLALINRNNEVAPAPNPVAPFKSFGYLKNPDMASLTNENWNSRFSNIKTNFDKVSLGNEEKEKPKIRPGKRLANFLQASQACEPRPVNEIPRGNFPLANLDSGFRPSPSSPFRRLEKPAAKVPPAYQWTKPAAPPVTNSLREKARMMFDRENVQPQAPSSKLSRRSHHEFFEKPNFPRLPWTDHEEKGESGETITENGRLDYRSFCKQFAPFVGKGASFDSRSNRGHSEEQRNAGVIDGKLSFKMFPDNSAHVQQRYPERSFAVNETPLKSGEHPVTVKSEAPSCDARNSLGETTIRGSSSVAIQTGMNDEHLDEGRSFRVAPKISKGPAAICSNAAVQTSGSEPEKPACSNGQWKSSYCDASDASRPDDYRGFVLDHNQNYRLIPGDADYGSTESASREERSPEPIAPRGIATGEKPKRYTEEEREVEEEEEDKTTGNYEPEVDWPVENTGFLEDRNIQNQDISPEVGVVTRYTCAIATVASVDSPEPRSEEIGAMDSRTSSSPSPSQSWSWSRTKPSSSETVATEDEIRRHNLLQQSLVRRLQNERTSLNEQRRSPSRLVETTVDRFHEVSGTAVKTATTRFLSPDTIRRQELPAATVRSTSPIPIAANRVGALREAYELAPINRTKQIEKERSPVPNGATPIDSSDEYLVSCASKPSRSIVLSKSESWHQLALSNHYPRPPRMNATTGGGGGPSQPSSLPKPPTKPKVSSSSSHKFRSKQYEASSSSDSVKRMESKIRRYFEQPTEPETKDPTSRSKRSSPRGKGLIGLSRSRTMPGISEERFRLLIPASQPPLLNVNTADVDKVFDDLFQEATRTEHQ